MKHFQEEFKSDLQAVKIRLGHFIEMFHICQPQASVLCGFRIPFQLVYEGV